MNRRTLLLIPAAGLAAVFGSHLLFDDPPKQMPHIPRRPKPSPPRRKPVKIWATSAACEGRKQCCACRGDAKFQTQLAEHFIMPDGWPECPHGITADTLPDPSPKPDAPEWYTARRAICKSCATPCWSSNCRRNKAIRRPSFACPRNLFRPVMATETP